MQRLFIHYIAAFFVLTLYGGQVCPYVESLALSVWAVSTFTLFTGTFALHAYLFGRLSAKNEIVPSEEIFKISFAVFVSSGFVIGIFNYIVHSFPPASGLKLIVGWLLIGFFMALDLSLENRQKIIQYMAATGKNYELRKSYVSLTKKFLAFSIILTVSVLGVIFLVVIKDLDWIFSEAPGAMSATVSILKEFFFIFAVIMAYSALVVTAFTKNLRLYLGYQNSTMSEVVNGNLNASVPVSSLDEFGLMAEYTNEMIKSLRERTEMLQLTQDVSILSLASLAETRDNETGAHIMRTQRYVLALAEELKDHPKYKDMLTKENIDLINKSAPLHDIGKVGIPDSILLKPGKLDEDEFKIMKRHPYYGKKALQSAGRILGQNSFLKFAEEIAFTHHEKWNGSGYPRGLSGDEIPLSGRLMAIADVYDALISKRVYKEAFSHEKAKEIIIEGRETHFDPVVVDAFIRLESEFMRIAKDYSDENYRNSQITI